MNEGDDISALSNQELLNKLNTDEAVPPGYTYKIRETKLYLCIIEEDSNMPLIRASIIIQQVCIWTSVSYLFHTLVI